MTDRWIVFVLLEFVSAGIGFLFGYYIHSWWPIMIGFLFFSIGAFAATRWGFEKWKGKQKQRKRTRK